MNESANKCYSCEFHRQDCTFAVSSHLGKRKLDGAVPEPVKRYLSFFYVYCIIYGT